MLTLARNSHIWVRKFSRVTIPHRELIGYTYSVMFLFAGELAGLVMNLSLPQYRDTEPKPWSPAEAGVVWAGVGACLMYLVGTTFTAMCLGRNRRISCTILSQERTLEKA